MAETRARGWWIPYIFFGMFGIVVAVNGALFYFATSTFSGLQTERSYDLGLTYNKVLAQAEAQSKLGWAVALKVVPSSSPGSHQADIAVTYKDRDGKPVEGLSVRAVFDRPTQNGLESAQDLTMSAPGHYGLKATMPLPGQWDMQVIASKDGQILYQIADRIIVP